MRRIKTGIQGFDEMICGGLFAGRTYVLKGGPGSGKTIFGVQFLLEGVRNGENVLYITLEESKEELFENMLNFNWNLRHEEKFHLYDASPTAFEGWKLYSEEFINTGKISLKDFCCATRETIERIKPTRLVVDPITIFELIYSSEVDLRIDLISLLRLFKEYNITVLLISEAKADVQTEEYLASGVFELRTYEIHGTIIKGILIKKLRGSKFDEAIRPYGITDKGFVVFNNENLPL